MISELDQQEIQAWVDIKQSRLTQNCCDCKGEGHVEHYVVEGGTHHITTLCRCNHRDELRVLGELIWENVDPAYRFVTLGSLEPSDKSSLSLERQVKVLTLLRAKPDDGYALFGAPGIGKTVWTTALYVRALFKRGLERRKYFNVMRLSTKRMLDEHTAYATTQFENDLDRALNQPSVTAARIHHIRQEQGEVPRLFLDEIDKVKETDSRRNNLFEILDALQSNGGQLVVNSNLRPEEFAEKFGADLWWRINKMATVVSLF